MSDDLSPEENDMREDYAISLLDLTFNSKPIINMLTTIAQENLHAAKPIVKAIEHRIASAPPNQRLPCIYLLDSICKNVGSPFTSLFSRDLYKTFMACYTNVVDNNVTRNKLKDLFKTWKLPVAGSHSSAPVFSTETTDKIEEALYKYEGTLSRLRGGPVYGNPAPYATSYQPPYNGQSFYERPISIRPTARELLLSGMEDLLRTLESCIKIDPYKYQPYFGRIQEFRNLYDRLRSFEVSPNELEYMREELHGIDMLCKQLSNSFEAPVGTPAMTTSELLDQLAKTGLINSGPVMPTEPVVELNSVAMLTTRLSLVGILYDSMPLQCLQCGQRWRDTEADRALKDEHLDRHFKTNRRLQEHSVRAQSRALYMTEIEWIDFTVGGSEVQKPAQPGVSAAVAEVEQSVPKPSDPALSDYRCPSCQEHFESFWDDPAEEWKWRNAIDVNGVILHPLCYADLLAKQARSDAKPAADHEAAAVKQEAEEGMSKKEVGSDEEDDNDIALPMYNHAPPALNSPVEEQSPAIKDEAAGEIGAPFVLTDALRASLSTLSATNGFKRKASEDGEDDGRRIKQEL